MAKAPLDVNDQFFADLQDALKGITTIVTDWQKKDAALSQLAENHAASSNEAPGFEHDARVQAHKKALRNAMAGQEGAPPEGGMMLPPGMDGGMMPPPMGPEGPPMMPPPGLPGLLPPPMG